MTRGRWTRGASSRRSFETHKAAIGSACQAFIDQVLKPRFLPEVCPTEFNYPIDLNGRWHGANYRFIQRYRSGFVDNAGWEFDAPFTRLEYVAHPCFHLSYLRHTGQWHRLYCEVRFPGP